MLSPWLNIPLSDYEGHMSHPSISQANMLAQQFANLLTEFSPTLVAVIGCAGGNGFEHTGSESVDRVVGVGINPRYIKALSDRYAEKIPSLELYVADVQEPSMPLAPVALIYAALMFEYVDLPRTLLYLNAVCQPSGVLAAILQPPSKSTSQFSPSPFTNFLSLGPAMQLVSPSDLSRSTSTEGFLELVSRHISQPSGRNSSYKSLACGTTAIRVAPQLGLRSLTYDGIESSESNTALCTFSAGTSIWQIEHQQILFQYSPAPVTLLHCHTAGVPESGSRSARKSPQHAFHKCAPLARRSRYSPPMTLHSLQ